MRGPFFLGTTALAQRRERQRDPELLAAGIGEAQPRKRRYIIGNAGGVTVSYFEWVQDFSSFFWTEDEINVRLDTILIGALRKLWDTADRHRITLRTATFAVACERILTAREERGLYP